MELGQTVHAEGEPHLFLGVFLESVCGAGWVHHLCATPAWPPVKHALGCWQSPLLGPWASGVPGCQLHFDE